MINAAPKRINSASRTVTLKHPNSMDCEVWRKVVLRTAPGGEEMGGRPTLGGLGVLATDEEPEFEYRKLGEGRIHFTDRYDGMLSTADRGDSLAPEVALSQALIEPLEAGAFTIKREDLVGVMPGGGVLIGYEIVDIPANVNIYPYTSKYVLAPRDVLTDLGPWAD
ncbi:MULTISPECIES: hypothetical protein [Burkholderia cepacia complex]|jgi:hypothetical protein|uniref:hypothetical protein n=1 Tax=Burkholderia cepacia complex TaxID=87882 RepID=UPI001589C9C9|nr:MULTISPECIES: hypothetical protein [Burkholderia cepacia complex]MCA8037048.1 hypothetical protein [Burkholderia arboris]